MWTAHRLPKPEDLTVDGEVLVTTSTGRERVAVWNDNYWTIDGRECTPCEIVAWMPLPEPYIKEDDYAKSSTGR